MSDESRPTDGQWDTAQRDKTDPLLLAELLEGNESLSPSQRALVARDVNAVLRAMRLPRDRAAVGEALLAALASGKLNGLEDDARVQCRREAVATLDALGSEFGSRVRAEDRSALAATRYREEAPGKYGVVGQAIAGGLLLTAVGLVVSRNGEAGLDNLIPAAICVALAIGAEVFLWLKRGGKPDPALKIDDGPRKPLEVDVHDELGLGPFTVSHRAISKKSGRPIVRKTMRLMPEVAASQSLIVEMHLRQVGTSVQLRSPLVQDLAHVEGSSTTFLIDRLWVDGWSFAQLLSFSAAGKRPTVAVAVDLVFQLLLALEDLHLFKVERTDGTAPPFAGPHCHRALSPHNVFLQRAGPVVVTDVGFARVELRHLVPRHAPSEQRRAPWMAPEEARGEPSTIESNLFTSAAMLYALLSGTGQPPAQPPQPLRELNPEVPQKLAAVIGKALSADPVARGESPRELGVELKIGAGTLNVEEEKEQRALKAYRSSLGV